MLGLLGKLNVRIAELNDGPFVAARRGVVAGEQANLILATTALHIRSTGF